MDQKIIEDSEFDIVELYYPNCWRQNIGNHVSKEDLRFNWFLCSQRFANDEDFYVIEIPLSTRFYCANTGKTLKIKPEFTDSSDKKPTLFILSDQHNRKKLEPRDQLNSDFLPTTSPLVVQSPSKTIALKSAAKLIISLAEVGKVDGIAVQYDCNGKDNGLLCSEAKFIFKRGILGEIENGEKCGIVRYSKKYNSTIRDVIPNFPTCREIDDVLENYPCNITSQILYQDLAEYFEIQSQKYI